MSVSKVPWGQGREFGTDDLNSASTGSRSHAASSDSCQGEMATGISTMDID